MVPRLSWSALLAVVAAVACGGQSIEDGTPRDGTSGTDPGGTESGGTASGGTESGGTASGGTESGGTASGGTGSGGEQGGWAGVAGFSGAGAGGVGGQAACTRFDDELPMSVPIWIVNETSRTLHLGPTETACQGAPLFHVFDALGKPLEPVGWCRVSCEVLREQHAGGCPAICNPWETVTLAPKEQVQVAWSGQYRVQGSIPNSCLAWDEPQAELQCDQAKTIRPGMFTFRARAGSELDCEPLGTCNPCVPQASGGCRTTAAIVHGTMSEAVTQAMLFGPYGSYSPTQGGASGAAPPPPAVRLVFTE